MFTYIYNIIVLKFKIDFPNLCNLNNFFDTNKEKSSSKLIELCEILAHVFFMRTVLITVH